MLKHALLVALALFAVCGASRADNAAPIAKHTAYSGFLVVTSEPQASDAGANIIRHGGSAVDAAVAVQAVLGLIEAPSSGLGGGAFLVYRDAKTGNVTTYDGRETAPASTKPDQFLGPDGRPSFDKWLGGGSVGVPGTVAMLALAQKEHGKLAWPKLFEPAIALAQNGFTVDKHLHDYVERTNGLDKSPGVAAYLYGSNGQALPIGTKIRNADYARTLKLIAKNPRAINEGPIAKNIAAAVSNAFTNPVAMTTADLAAYKAQERAPVCAPYRIYTVCGMGPPSSGGITVLQILGMLERFPIGSLGAQNPESWHLIAEAERLAFADRTRWLGDSDVVDVPVPGLIDRGYLKSRSALIDEKRAAGQRQAGEPPRKTGMLYAPQVQSDHPSTTHFTIVDKEGNVAAVTSSIQLGFGSHIFVDGFFLNNELTDFSMMPEMNGVQVANAAAPGKRPLSSMSPTIVLDKDGKLVMALGSPGGVRIIGYVVKALIASLDWNMSMQQAVDLANFDNLNGKTEIEAGPGADTLKAALEAMGHEVAIAPMESSLQGFRVVPGGYDGGTDRRRDGAIEGGAVLQ